MSEINEILKSSYYGDLTIYGDFDDLTISGDFAGDLTVFPTSLKAAVTSLSAMTAFLSSALTSSRIPDVHELESMPGKFFSRFFLHIRYGLHVICVMRLHVNNCVTVVEFEYFDDFRVYSNL